jgi:hypothetical protein
VLIYGIAEASTAYLITKITEPPPPPQYVEEFKKRDVRWENKHEFLNLPIDALDKLNVKARERREQKLENSTEIPARQFT